MPFSAKLTDLSKGHRHIPEDMQRRYQGTILLVTKENKTYPAFLRGHIDRDVYQFQTPSNIIQIEDEDPSYDVDVFLPTVGYYNINGNVYYLVKKPERQWKRSFCKGIYQFDVPLISYQLEIPRIQAEMYLQYAAEILHPTYAHLDQINSPLFTNVAINRQFAVIKYKGTQFLVYRKRIIGELNHPTKTITLIVDLMRQEVLDLFKRTGVTKWKLV